MIFDRDMPDKAAYWAPELNDGFGQIDFSSSVPVEIMCRWQDSNDLGRAPDGREIRYSHVAYVNQPVEVGGYLLLTDTLPAPGTNPIDVKAAEILNVYMTKDLDGGLMLIKVMM